MNDRLHMKLDNEMRRFVGNKAHKTIVKTSLLQQQIASMIATFKQARQQQ